MYSKLLLNLNLRDHILYFGLSIFRLKAEILSNTSRPIKTNLLSRGGPFFYNQTVCIFDGLWNTLQYNPKILYGPKYFRFKSIILSFKNCVADRHVLSPQHEYLISLRPPTSLSLKHQIHRDNINGIANDGDIKKDAMDNQ